MKIFDEILKIRDKYDDGKRYSQYRYEKTSEGEEIEFRFEDELKKFCETNNVNYKSTILLILTIVCILNF